MAGSAESPAPSIAERDSARSSSSARGLVLAAVTTGPIDSADHAALVAGKHNGAVVTFSGVVRDHDHGSTVARLTYEAHPAAATVLQRELEALIPELSVSAVAVSHRIGELGIGDSALEVAVSAPHRAEAFAACARIVDVVKEVLPVWKHQMFADGTSEWVNCA